MKLYVISDEVLTPNKSLSKSLNRAIEGGCDIFQFRDKHSKDSEIKSLALELNEICAKNNVLFVLNDRVELAIELNLSALHVGKDELMKFSFDEIRKNFGGKIGVSCYGDVSRAKGFEEKGADYVAFGSIFFSKTKPDSNLVGVEIINRAKKVLNCEVCAIGGINLSNASLLKNADMIAIISAVWNGDVIKNLREFRRILH